MLTNRSFKLDINNLITVELIKSITDFRLTCDRSNSGAQCPEGNLDGCHSIGSFVLI